MIPQDLFGTDGIRGIFGQPPLTLDCLWVVGYSVARWLRDDGKLTNPYVVLGRDPRTSGKAIEEALTGGLIEGGAYVESMGLVSTPALSFLTRYHHASAGLMISASHNPSCYNGIKFFTGNGEKFSTIHEQMITQKIILFSQKRGFFRTPSLFPSPLMPYKEAVYSIIPSLKGIRVVLDCAHGACSSFAPSFFQELGAEVLHLIGVTPTGHNINDKVGTLYPEALCKAVVTYGADLGISFDGDGDRILMVDKKGNLHDGDQILARFALEGRSPGIVGTAMTNGALEYFLQEKGYGFIRTEVGDRKIAKAMKKEGWILGGEPCGHILRHEFLPTGDGLFCGLLLAAHASKEPLSPLFSYLPSILKSVALPSRETLFSPKVLSYIEEIKTIVAQEAKARFIVRPSGTEPVVRILMEAETLSPLIPFLDKLVSYLKN